MIAGPKQPQPRPRGNHDRVILHFDYDCFYAQVVENRRPALRSLPLGVQQKGILATCNYAARRRGVRKLMPVAEARRACPELRLVRGEDLSPFRDVSKRLYALLRAHVAAWGGRAERLGLDEVFLDATDLVAYNAALLGAGAGGPPARAFFRLSREDPGQGFPFDASAVAGCVAGSPPPAGPDALGDPLYARLLLASHLARHLRLRLEDEGYTSACGVATNKVLAKLAGGRAKPRGQTTLLSLRGGGDVERFMDPYGLRAVPGIGARTTRAVEAWMLGAAAAAVAPGTDAYTGGSTFTVGECRARPGMGPALLESLLAGPGAERGAGERVWALLHGVDGAEVKPAADVPTQISIEDTYQGRPLAALPEVARELRRLAGSLLRRMRVDLLEGGEGGEGGGGGGGGPPPPRWLARPRTLRLSTRPWTSPAEGRPYNFARASRSQPLPGFVFGIAARRGGSDDDVVVAVADRLVAECLLPLFHRLHTRPAGGGEAGHSIAMLNVCVANMAVVGSEDGAGAGAGRDISAMFRRQEEVLREFRVRDDDDDAGRGEEAAPAADTVREGTDGDGASEDDDEEVAWDDGGGGIADGGEACALCGHYVPAFAATAHDRYHALGD